MNTCGGDDCNHVFGPDDIMVEMDQGGGYLCEMCAHWLRETNPCPSSNRADEDVEAVVVNPAKEG